MFRARVLKFLNSLATLAILALIGWLFIGGFDGSFAVGAVLISGLWLGLTYASFGRLLDTYCSFVSRLRVCIPLTVGLGLSLVGIVAAGVSVISLVAVAEIVAWGLIYRTYRQNKALFEKQGHGPLPAGVWMKPDREMFEPGWFLLSAGDMFAPRMHNAVDHAELVIRNKEKRKRIEAFSTWIGHGTVINLLRRITQGVLQKDSFYIALRPKTPLTDEESDVLYDVCQMLKARNGDARDRFNKSLERLIKCLPQAWQPWALKHLKWDGYDYLGIIRGHRRDSSWTCFGSTLEAWELMCDEMELRGRPRARLRHYGTGLFGLGTGILDPLVVIRLLDDPELQLITLEDKAIFEAKKSVTASAAKQAAPADEA